MDKDIKLLNKVISFKYRELNKHYFSWLYPFTNENIHEYYKYIPFKDKDVLTTTSSGDHALNSILCGAKNIDTFDINPLAKYYSELKIAAIKTLSLEDFIKFLYKKGYFNNKHYLSKDAYNILKKELKDEYREFWDYFFSTYSSKKIYKSFLFTDDFLDLNKLKICNGYINEKNYFLLREKLKSIEISYHDISIENLSDIKKQFDIIILSNICAYLDFVYLNREDYLGDIKKELNNIQKQSSIVVLGYLYSELIGLDGSLGIYNEEEVNEYFKNIKYIDIESSNTVSYPKTLKKLLNSKDRIIITK